MEKIRNYGPIGGRPDWKIRQL